MSDEKLEFSAQDSPIAFTVADACAAVDGWGEGAEWGLHKIARALRAEVARLDRTIAEMNDAADRQIMALSLGVRHHHERVERIVAQLIEDAELLGQINALLRPFNCVATELGPDAVGVMGDARQVGASVFVTFPDNPPDDLVSTVSTKIINEVRGVTRVLMNVAPNPEEKTDAV